MKTIELKACAKINLSIDVLRKRADGYHEVAMVMQQIDLWDRVRIGWEAGAGGVGGQTSGIRVDSNEPALPKDEKNIAYKAADLFRKLYPEKDGNINIYIDKKIPTGAGLGGGSADAAAVFHGLNLLWGLNLPVSKLMEMGALIGADVPFLIMSQGASTGGLNPSGEKLSTCALAEGIGEKLTPLPPLKGGVVLKKPDLFISTAEIYKAVDLEKIEQRPKTQDLIEGLYEEDFGKVAASMYNVLEEVAVKKYPVIKVTIEEMDKLDGFKKVMMSGSGPTVFGLLDPLSFPNE